MSYCRNRRTWGSEHYNPPSRFLNELPTELIELRTSVMRPRFVTKYAHSSNYFDQSHAETFDSNEDEPWAKSQPRQQNAVKDPLSTKSSSAGSNCWRSGSRVRHPQYGPGSIFETEGSGDNLKISTVPKAWDRDDPKLSVLFDDRSIKKFVAK